MKKTTILLVMVLAIAILGFAASAFALPKDGKPAAGTTAPDPAITQKQPVPAQAPRMQPIHFDDIDNINATTPQAGAFAGHRGIGAQRLSSAGVPYVLVSSGHPETVGGNNQMRPQVAVSGSGVVHMVYRVFDADTDNVVKTTADSNRNGFYFYNAYDCSGSNALRNGRLDEPMEQVFGGADARPRKIQLGGVFIKPGGSNIPIAYGSNYILRTDLPGAGRYTGSPQTLGLVKDGAECLGLFSMDTSTTHIERAFHPVFYAVPGTDGLNDSTYVAVCYRNGFPNLGRFWSTRTRGLTWQNIGANMGTASAWYNSFAVTGSGNDIYFVSMTDPNDLTAFVTTERPVYTKVTYNPGTGTFTGVANPPNDILLAASYSKAGFLGCMTGISAIMIGDTLSVAWLTWNNWLSQNVPGPGGEVLHALVFPDGTAEVHKVADINIDGRLPKITTTLFGFGSLAWSQVSQSYDEANDRLYVLWAQPVEDGNPNDADYDWGDYESSGTLAVDDIFCSVSPFNGRGFDEPANVTQTNNPGCDGSVGDECEHEYWFSAHNRVVNDTIWTVALVNKYPGIQESAIASGITPDVGPQTAYRDEFRLYKAPARAPVLTARGALGPAPGDTIQPYNVKLTPGALTPVEVNLQLANIGLLGFITDSIRIAADLNSAGLATSSNFTASNPVPVGGGYNFKLFLDASLVTPAQAGTHNGLIQVFGHSTSPVTSVVVGQNIGAYIIPSLCLNRKARIHSASNETDIGNQGSIKDAGGPGMAYPAIPNRDNFYDGGVWIANSSLNAEEGVVGVPRKVTRQLFADKFLRCLSDNQLDSTPGTGAYYNLSVKSIATDVEDSTLCYLNIWEQSTHTDSSDFLVHTVKVVNIGTSPIDSVAMGATYDIDVASDNSNPPQNTTGDTSVSFLGRTWWIGWAAGNDVNADTCSPNSEMYGIVIVPGSIGNPGDFVRPRGAVMYHQAGFSYNTDNHTEGGGDSLCQRYMWNVDVVTSTRRRTHDTLTGVWDDTSSAIPNQFVCGSDTYLCKEEICIAGNPANCGTPDTVPLCPGGVGSGVRIYYPSADPDSVMCVDSVREDMACGAGYRADEGFMSVAKKVYNMQPNAGAGALVARYGLGGLVAGTDSAFKGNGETYTYLHLASNNGFPELLLNAQKAINWYVNHANLQAGSYVDVVQRGDFDNNHALTGADAVAQVAFVYLGTYPGPLVGPFSDCVADVNLDGAVTSADYVNVLNRVYLGPPNCPWCLTRCP